MTITLTDDQTAKLLTALGLPDDTADADLIVATVEDLAKADSGDIVAAAKRAGSEVVDKTTLDGLRADAQRGRDLITAAAKREVDDKVDAAVRAGKIPPARKGHWVTLVTNDASMADVLAGMPDGLAVNMTESGVGATHDGDLTEPAAWFN